MAPSDNIDPKDVADKAKDLLGKGKDALADGSDDAADGGGLLDKAKGAIAGEGDDVAGTVSDGETVTSETVTTGETVSETVVTETVVEEAVVEEVPVAETVVTETVVEETVVEEVPVTETVVTETVVEETVVEEVPVTETVVTETVVEEVPVTETVVTETVVEETVVEEVASPVAAASTKKAVVKEVEVDDTVVKETAVVEAEPVETHEVVETVPMEKERSGTWPAVALGLLVLFAFILLGLLLSTCGSDEEAVGTTTPVTTAVPRTVVTVDPETGVDPVRRALDANGYEAVDVGLDGNGRVKITGEVPDLATKLDAANIATAALPAGVLLSNQLTIAAAPELIPPDREDAVRSALDGGGFDDITANTGDPFVLTGVVASANAKAEAGTLAEAAADPFDVDNRITIVAPDLATAGVPDDTGIVLNGEVPDEDVRAAMVAAAAAEYGADNVTDQMTIADGDRGDFVVRAEVASRGAQRRLQATGQAIADAGGYTFVDEITRPNASELADALNDLVELEPILFDVNSAAIRSDSAVTLDKAVAFFDEFEGSVEVGGHTDSDGSEAANQGLSDARAASVRQYLTDQGVDADRMTAAGSGEAEPVATNETPEGRQLNRRIEFRAT